MACSSSKNTSRKLAQRLEEMLHTIHVMSIDMMRHYIPVTGDFARVDNTDFPENIELAALRHEAAGRSDRDVWIMFMEQMHTAMATTFNLLHAQIPAAARTQDYGRAIRVMPCPVPTSPCAGL